MLKINEFAKLVKVPVRTIRFYDSIGLIKPVEVDKFTGYRYFDETSAERIFEIMFLKNLGFSLDEIKNPKNIDFSKKEKEMFVKRNEIQQILKILSKSQEPQGRENEMAKFVKKQTKEVLQDLFGAWKYVESLGKGKYEFQIKTLYYLKDAEAYWVVEFFKDEVKIGNKIYPFKLKDGKLLIEIEANNTAVFEKVDSIIRTKDDIATKDDINIPFVEDKNVLGVWKCIDLVDNEKQFNPNSKYYEHYMMWDKFVFSPNGELMVVFEDKGTNNIKYTKGIIINEMFQNTATAYKVKKIDGKQYMFKEHKSGDYVWGKMKPYLYVFKKEV